MKKGNSRIITGVIIVALMVVFSSVDVLAVDPPTIIGTPNTQNTENTVQNVNNNTISGSSNQTNTQSSNTTYKQENTEKLPQAGENDVYVVAALVTVCALSAIYAYKKIRDFDAR